MRLQSQRALAKISEIEEKINEIKGLGAVIDQNDFVSAQYLAVHAGKDVVSPVYSDNKEAFDEAPPSSVWEEVNDSKSTQGMDERLGVLDTRIADLQLHFAHVSANLSERKITLEKIPSVLPVQGEITSQYGMRQNPITFAPKKHKGIDIAAPLGSPVLATAEGKVTKAMYSKSYGWLIELDHDNGVKTRYAHSSKLMVKRGERVKKLQAIAYVGSTGHSTACHCHYEVLVNDTPVNPEKFLLKKPVYSLKLQSAWTYESADPSRRISM